MNEHQVLDMVKAAKADFRVKCSKYSGAVSVEIIRSVLLEHGIITSNRDVFIRRVPVEIDFLWAKPGVAPEHGLLYLPEDVLAAFEIKNAGSFGETTIQNTKRCFSLIQQSNPKIYCAYVTIAERLNFRWAVDKKNLGSNADAYTLFWHSGSSKKIRYEPSGDWKRLLDDLQALDKV